MRNTGFLAVASSAIMSLKEAVSVRVILSLAAFLFNMQAAKEDVVREGGGFW